MRDLQLLSWNVSKMSYNHVHIHARMLGLTHDVNKITVFGVESGRKSYIAKNKFDSTGEQGSQCHALVFEIHEGYSCTMLGVRMSRTCA